MSALLGAIAAMSAGAIDLIFVPFDRARLLEGRLPSALVAPEILVFSLLMLAVVQAVFCGLEERPVAAAQCPTATALDLAAFSVGASVAFVSLYFLPGLMARRLGAGVTFSSWSMLVVAACFTLSILALSTLELTRIVRTLVPRPLRPRACLLLVIAMVLFSGRVQPVHEMGWTAIGAAVNPLRYALESLSISWDYALTGLIPRLSCRSSPTTCSSNDLSGTFAGGACMRTSATGQRKAVPSLSTILRTHGDDAVRRLAAAAGTELNVDATDDPSSTALSERIARAERMATYCFSPDVAGAMANPWWWSRRDPVWDVLVSMDGDLALYRGDRHPFTACTAMLLLLTGRTLRRSLGRR